MRVKFTVLSLAMLLSSVTFAWGFFGPSAKDVESIFIEKWHGVGVLDMKSVKAAKTSKKDIWKVTYTENYYVREGNDNSTSGSTTNDILAVWQEFCNKRKTELETTSGSKTNDIFTAWLEYCNKNRTGQEKQEKPKLKHVVETQTQLVSVRKVDDKLKMRFLSSSVEE